MALKENILCAAIWYKEIPLRKKIQGVLPKNCDEGIVISGHRHGQCMWVMGCLTGLRSVTYAPDGVGEYIQGFLTNHNRFVDRKEALKIALDNNQVLDLKEIRGDELYSEDLY